MAKYKQWKEGQGDFADKAQRTFEISRRDIANNKYDLSINRYKEVQYKEIECEPPSVILDQLEALESEIQADLGELKTLLAS